MPGLPPIAPAELAAGFPASELRRQFDGEGKLMPLDRGLHDDVLDAPAASPAAAPAWVSRP